MNDDIVFDQHVKIFRNDPETPVFMYQDPKYDDARITSPKNTPTKLGMIALSVALAFDTVVQYATVGSRLTLMFSNPLAMQSYTSKVKGLSNLDAIYDVLPEFKIGWGDGMSAVSAVAVHPQYRKLALHLWLYENCAGKVYTSGDLLIFENPSDMSLFLLSRQNES